MNWKFIIHGILYGFQFDDINLFNNQIIEDKKLIYKK